jgi:hypothetical protein
VLGQIGAEISYFIRPKICGAIDDVPDNQPTKPTEMVQLPPEEDKQWAQVVGSLVLLFNSAELISLNFIAMINGDTARQAAMSKKFYERIAMIKELIAKSNWPDDEKTEALKLWDEVDVKREFRNDLAHNPFIVKMENGNRVAGILIIRELRGPPPYNPTLILFKGVLEMHNRMKEIVFALNMLTKPR